MFFILTLNKKK